MIDISNASLSRLSVHQVGTKLNGDLVLSSTGNEPDDELAKHLTAYFLHPFTEPMERYRFAHPSGLQYNEVYNFTAQAFKVPETFHEQSVAMARHLFEQSNHPKIKTSELFIALFENCVYENKEVTVLGLFRSETRSSFIESRQKNKAMVIDYHEGLLLNKPEKACVVINTGTTDLHVFTIDSRSKTEEAHYWKNLFLQVEPVADSYHFTKNMLSVTKDFITTQGNNGEPVNKMEQIGQLQRSVDYFKNNDSFDINEYQKEIFTDEERIRDFQQFGSKYMMQHDLDISGQFPISASAVKKQVRQFKSVLKLDKNFHIYIHGDRELIEQGYDEMTGKKFYKIYFDEET